MQFQIGPDEDHPAQGNDQEWGCRCHGFEASCDLGVELCLLRHRTGFGAIKAEAGGCQLHSMF